MKKLFTASFVFILSVYIFSFFSVVVFAQQESGCCRFEEKENGLVIGEHCYSYNNQISADGQKNFSRTSCEEKKGAPDDTTICVDLYYSQTDASISATGEFPVQGIRCIENPKKIAELQDEKKRGVLSKECLNANGNSISDCLVSSFFPDIGLPGGADASTNPDVVKSLLLVKVGLVIGLILGAVGIIFLIIIIYAGIQWLIADDSEKKVAESKERLRNAVIGLIITMFAYGFSYFIFNALARAS